MTEAVVAPPVTPPVTPPVAPPVTPPAAWYEGKADPEMVGYMQSKGWDKDPVLGAIEASKAHRELQKMIGVPADEILRMPKPSAQPADLDAFWQRLGAPKEAKEIDLSVVKSAAGTPIDDKLADAIRAAAVAGRVPKDAAVAVAAAVQKHFDAVEAQRATVAAGNVQQQEQARKQNWGANDEANFFVARNAFLKLAARAGMDEAAATKEANEKFRAGGGMNAITAEMWRIIGTQMGEDRYVGSGVGGNNMPMTREAAMAEIRALKGDAQFRERLLKGGVEETKQWTALHKIAYPRAA